jgi:myo-inositol-1(or 4)-monophosphatase
VAGRVALLDAALEATSAAAAVARRRAFERHTAERKGEGDYVTAADREAEAAALSVLARRVPDVPVVGEESGGALSESRCWLVDPIDGTTNYLRGFPVVGVSVAYVEEGSPAVAVVAAPLLGRHWSAVAGGGARDSEGALLAVGTRPGRGVVSTGFPFRRKERLDGYLPVLAEALRDFEDLRRTGAASLDLAFTAAGTWDAFFELGLGPWDLAAGTLLVREAGGVVTDWRGDDRAMLASGDILAGSPACHERLLDLVRRARAARHP